MHAIRTLLTLLLAFAATSFAFDTIEVRKEKGNSTRSMGMKGDSTKKECHQMSKLQKLTMLASNQTKLDMLVSSGKMTADMVTALKAKAADATTKLQTMSSNSTLTGECAIINSAEKTKGECREMKGAERLSKLASNQTALDAMIAKQKLNSTQVDKLKERITKSEAMFKTLSANTTLVDICKKQQQQKANSNRNSTSSGSSSASASKASSAPAQATKNSASELSTASTMYLFVPALAGVFALFL